MLVYTINARLNIWVDGGLRLSSLLDSMLVRHEPAATMIMIGPTVGDASWPLGSRARAKCAALQNLQPLCMGDT